MHQAEIVIVGGGVIGASIFYQLSITGLKPLLLEKGSFGSGSTGKSGGFVRIYHPDPYLTDLAMDSFQDYVDFKEKIGETCGFHKTGMLFLEKAEKITYMRKEVSRIRERGFDATLLERDEGEQRFSTIKWDGVDAAVYESEAGYADPLLTTRAWIQRAREHGGLACEGVQVYNILSHNGKITGLETSLGTIHTGIIIVAAGAWSKYLLAELPIDMPVRPKLIQINKFHIPRLQQQSISFIDNTTQLYSRPEKGGLSLIGYPVDVWDIHPDDVESSIDLEFAEKIRKLSEVRFNWVQDSFLSGGRRSFDGYTQDSRGFLTSYEHVEGMIVASGWSGGGFKVAPAVGKKVVEMVLNA